MHRPSWLQSRNQVSGETGAVHFFCQSTEGFQKTIQRGLDNLQDKIDSDEDQTYRQELNLRLAEFNPLKEIKTLVFGKDQTS